MDYYIGTILLYAFNYAPEGWLSCDGQTMNITQYQALFALLGTTYGGNGTTNFLLPNLYGASPIPAMKYYICITGIWPSRQ
jgi:microcystin-dependent protein